MIVGEHSIIRGAGVDDAPFFHRLYLQPEPVSALLDQRREWWRPTSDELAELFAGNRGDLTRDLNVVEDKEGRVLGFAGIRTNARDPHFGNYVMMLLDTSYYDTPHIREVTTYLKRTAFRDKMLRKVMSHTLDHENAHREYLLQNGFESNGVQREVLYTGGNWHNLQSFSLTNPNL